MPLPATRQLVIAAAIFLATLVLSSAIVVALLVLLPADHFAPPGERRSGSPRRRLVGLAGRVARNLLGVLLIAVGVVLALPGVPGQGLLTIFAGLLLVDLPGKRRFERALLVRPAVRRAVDGLRARFGRPPLAGLDGAAKGNASTPPPASIGDGR